jgi:hypothetical protein
MAGVIERLWWHPVARICHERTRRLDDPQSRMTPYDDDYATCEMTYASLNAYSDTDASDWISAALSLEPSRTIGRTAHNREEPAKMALDRSFWSLSSKGHVDSGDVRRHLDWLLDQIEPSAGGIETLRTTPGTFVNVSCMWMSLHGQGGPTLWPEQMSRLSKLDLELRFDIYGATTNPDEGRV